MEWNKPELCVKPSVVPYNEIYCQFTTPKSPCAYCGGRYRRNMRRIDKKKICCDICYNITHLNASERGKLCVCYSKLSQLDIIRKTVDYIKEKDMIPFFDEIDKDVKIVPISVMEFSNILMNGEKLPKQMENYKIFLTQDYDTTFIDTFAYMFYQDEQDTKDTSSCDAHVMSKEEELFIKDVFA